MANRRQRIFIGDVQGCSAELTALLEQLRFDHRRHQLWFTGDLVNRGPDSLGVLRLVRKLGGDTVLGNHDLHLLRTAAGQRALRPSDTFQDVLDAADRDELLDWLRRRPLVKTWDDVMLVHAGTHPRWREPGGVARPLEKMIRRGAVPWDDPNLRFLVQVRHCDAQGSRPTDEERPPPGFAPWDAHYRGQRIIVFGHWAARGRVCGKRVRGLDTGCVWGGSLTAWLAGDNRFVSVPARKTYQRPKQLA